MMRTRYALGRFWGYGRARSALFAIRGSLRELRPRHIPVVALAVCLVFALVRFDQFGNGFVDGFVLTASSLSIAGWLK